MKKSVIYALLYFLPTFQVFSQPTEWTPKGIGGGGAFFAPSISPFNSSEIYINSDMSNLFHTTNSGLEWDVVPFTQITALVETNVQFTSDPNILYTVHGDWQRIPVKSTDGGKSWNPLPNDPTYMETFYLFADWNSTERIILSMYFDIFFSNDGGNTFSKIYTNTESDAAHIAGVFWNNENIFVATGRGLLISTDNGNTFNLQSIPGIPQDEGIITFCGAKENETIRFFCVTLWMDYIYPTQTGADHWGYKNVYKLDYGTSNSWVKTTNGLTSDDHPYFVSMARNNINTAYLAGGEVESYFPIVYKTTDGGSSWQSVFKTHNNENIYTGWQGYEGDQNWCYAEFAEGFTVAPTNPDIAVITDLGYAHITTNGGESWKQMYLSPADENPPGLPTPVKKSYHSVGLENTSSWWLTWSDENNIFTSMADIMAMRSEDGGNSWSFDYESPYINSVYQTLKHPTNNYLYAATSSVHDIYNSHRLSDDPLDEGTGDIRYSTDKGKTWSLLHDFGHPVIWLALDPNYSNKMYASIVHSTQGGIYVCQNIQAGSPLSWTKLTSPTRTEGHAFNVHVLNDGTLICCYSARLDETESFTNSSGVFVSTDGGNSWIDRSHSDMIYWTMDIVIDPHDNSQNTWYACVYSGWGGAPNTLSGLFRTTNRGLSWAKILDLYRVGSCTIGAENPNETYVTTEQEGLWYSSNLNETNPTFKLVDSYPFKHPQRVFYNPYNKKEIWIASFGNGLRVGNTSATSSDLSAVKISDYSLKQNYPNPFNSGTTIEFNIKTETKVVLKVFDLLGQEVLQLVDASYFPGTYRVNLNADNLPSGLYFYRIQMKDFFDVKKMLLLE
ncbi:T9SS type A sorting domain-containing protein [candidate division KSB1 bacterium]|nr:T9SS type A sorting domain-containing protein [candidate division KSB1 bacterium]